MKILCSKERLNYAVQIVQKAVATKNPLQILTGIYILAQNNKLELQATNYEVGISCTIDADIQEPGSTVLSGRYFHELVRRLPGESIEIASNEEDRTIKITSAYSQFNLLSFPVEEFPVIKPLDGERILSIKDSTLRDMIKKTVFACATDESRPIFTGGLLEADNEGIRMIATNTHRLALKKDNMSLPNNVKKIIPAKLLNELARSLVSDQPIDVNVYTKRNQIAFSFDNIYIISRVIEGQFPDYNKVIPPNFATVAIINTDQFLNAVERVSLLARDSDYNIIKFNFKSDSVVISSNNPDIGKACETTPANINGNDIEIAFNARYITDILKNIDSEDISFSLNTPLSPACIKPFGDENYIYIITPVRTN